MVRLFIGVLVGACLTGNAHAQTAKWVFSNDTDNPIPDLSTATTYPATIDVAGVTGVTYHVSVVLSVSSGIPRDLDLLLEDPAGNTVMLLSDVGPSGVHVGSWGSEPRTIDDCAPRALGDGSNPPGRYRPSNYLPGDAMDAPAPSGPYGNALAEFNQVSANGTWKLYAKDDSFGNFSSSVIHSWSLIVFTQPTPPPPPDSHYGLNPISCSGPDYDGDGRTDVAVYRPQTGEWFISRSGSAGSLEYHSWGAPASSGLDDIAVPADYDGDGVTDKAVFRRATGEWFVASSFLDGTLDHYTFGAASAANLGDTPVPGDYDGDGRDNAAIYRTTTGQWFVRNLDGSTTTINWGHPPAGDYPARR